MIHEDPSVSALAQVLYVEWSRSAGELIEMEPMRWEDLLEDTRETWFKVARRAMDSLQPGQFKSSSA